MAGWNNHGYLFTQQTLWLTFNGCSLCSAYQHTGELDFHYLMENIRSSPLLSSLGLCEEAGYIIVAEAAGRPGGWTVCPSLSKHPKQVTHPPALTLWMTARHMCFCEILLFERFSYFHFIKLSLLYGLRKFPLLWLWKPFQPFFPLYFIVPADSLKSTVFILGMSNIKKGLNLLNLPKTALVFFMIYSFPWLFYEPTSLSFAHMPCQQHHHLFIDFPGRSFFFPLKKPKWCHTMSMLWCWSPPSFLLVIQPDFRGQKNVPLHLKMPKNRLEAMINMLTLKGAPVYSLRDKFWLTFSEGGSGVTSLKGIQRWLLVLLVPVFTQPPGQALPVCQFTDKSCLVVVHYYYVVQGVRRTTVRWGRF